MAPVQSVSAVSDAYSQIFSELIYKSKPYYGVCHMSPSLANYAGVSLQLVKEDEILHYICYERLND